MIKLLAIIAIFSIETLSQIEMIIPDYEQLQLTPEEYCDISFRIAEALP